MKVIFATNEHRILNNALRRAGAKDRLISYFYLNQVKEPTAILNDIATKGVFEQPERPKKERVLLEDTRRNGLAGKHWTKRKVAINPPTFQPSPSRGGGVQRVRLNEAPVEQEKNGRKRVRLNEPSLPPVLPSPLNKMYQLATQVGLLTELVGVLVEQVSILTKKVIHNENSQS